MTADTMSAMAGLPPGILDRDAVAARIGIAAGSLTRYVARGDAPAPDGTVGASPWWHEKTIEDWIAARPGRGAGGGRPRKTEGSPS